jgi:hypothetical protein
VSSHIHRGIGLALLGLYAYLITHLSSLLPGLDFTPIGFPAIGNKSGVGFLIVLGLPLVSVACFLLPTHLMWWFSPRTPPDYEYLLTEGFWYLVGYVLLALSLGLFSLFRHPLI